MFVYMCRSTFCGVPMLGIGRSSVVNWLTDRHTRSASVVGCAVQCSWVPSGVIIEGAGAVAKPWNTLRGEGWRGGGGGEREGFSAFVLKL